MKTPFWSKIREVVNGSEGVEVSEASTLEKVAISYKQSFSAGIDYRLGTRRLVWLEPWMIDPPDGGYPFVEWTDLNGFERGAVLAERTAWVIQNGGFAQIEEDPLDRLTRDLNTIGMDEKDEAQAMAFCVDALTRCLRVSEGLRKAREASPVPVAPNAPVPARKGHLMAEGGVLKRVQDVVKHERLEYARKVSFDEPVNAFTMLYGDHIARGGDMLTGVTITDTEAHNKVRPGSNRVEVVYEARAISL